MLIKRLRYKYQIVIFTFSTLLLLLISLHKANTSPTESFYLYQYRIWEFMCGGLLFLLKSNIKNPIGPQQKNYLSVVGLLLIAITISYARDTSLWPGPATLPAIFGTCLIIACADGETFTGRMLTNAIVQTIGSISYSLYLWHQPLISIAKYELGNILDLPVKASILALSITLAFFTHKYIENVFAKKSKTNTFTLSACAAGIILIFGISQTLKSNFLDTIRYSQYEIEVFEQYEQRGQYVRSRFFNHHLTDFDYDDNSPNILIIGDSFGQDFTNILYENGIIEQLSLSTYYIPTRCGNVFTSEDVSQFIPERQRISCVSPARYENSRVLELIPQADQIWLTSLWWEWTFDYLPQTIENISALTNAEILVIGRKNFGQRSLSDFRRGGVESLLETRSVRPRVEDLLEQMALIVPRYTSYLDLQYLVCQSYAACTNTLNGRLPLSYDGGHLSPSGAKQIGEQLFELLSAQINTD